MTREGLEIGRKGRIRKGDIGKDYSLLSPNLRKP
jgi:hypothetical protein